MRFRLASGAGSSGAGGGTSLAKLFATIEQEKQALGIQEYSVSQVRTRGRPAPQLRPVSCGHSAAASLSAILARVACNTERFAACRLCMALLPCC